MSQNAIPAIEPSADPIAARIAAHTMSKRNERYLGEVRRLLDAGLSLMRQSGTVSRPKVADIVAAAGLSNDAFYRHFASKDELVKAILDDGTERLIAYLEHQMAKETTPAGQMRRWAEGILAQAADDETAAATLAVLWNAGGAGDGQGSGAASPTASLAALVHEPLAALGSTDAALDADLLAHAVRGKLGDFLWQRVRPSTSDIDHVVAFCLGAVTQVQ